MTQETQFQDVQLREQNEWRKVTVRVLLFVALGFAIPLMAYLVFGKVPHGLPKEQRAKIEIPAAPQPR